MPGSTIRPPSVIVNVKWSSSSTASLHMSRTSSSPPKPRPAPSAFRRSWRPVADAGPAPSSIHDRTRRRSGPRRPADPCRRRARAHRRSTGCSTPGRTCRSRMRVHLDLGDVRSPTLARRCDAWKAALDQLERTGSRSVSSGSTRTIRCCSPDPATTLSHPAFMMRV